MIKKTEELDNSEIKDLEEKYIEYFKMLNYGNKLDNVYNRSKAKSYAKDRLIKILAGQRTSYVYFEQAEIKGFITGRLYDDKIGWISDLFVEGGLWITPSKRIDIALSLFKELVKDFKEKGMESIATEVNLEDHDLINTFHNLGFTEGEQLDASTVGFTKNI